MQTYKLRLIVSILISILPSNYIRVLGYKYLLGYDIIDSVIGFRTIIVVNSFIAKDVIIGRNNKFTGPMSVTIQQGASINNNNIFNCGWWTKNSSFISENYERTLIIQKKVTITSGHYFDLVGKIHIGENSWIAGYNSQFWTHGIGVTDRNITIKDNSYIGSAVRFTPGITIAQNSLVAMGSVVTKHFNEKNVLIAGNPAKILKQNYNWNSI